MLKSTFRRWSIAFAIIWSFLVLYPQPTALGESVFRIFYPPVNPQAAEKLIPNLPDLEDPAILEKYILETMPYQYDWDTYNLPWYFPTAEEAVQKGKGDCKTRFIVLASLFEALSIPYELYLSPTHIWINYEGKTETKIENQDAAVFYYDEEGRPVLKIPQVNWKESVDLFWDAFWINMPEGKKKALLSGLAFSVLLFFAPDYRKTNLRSGKSSGNLL